MKDIFKSKSQLIEELEDARRLLSQKEAKGLKPEADFKRVQDELVQSETLLRNFFNSPGLMCGVVEIEGDDIRYISVNVALAAMYGFTPEAMVQKLASEIGIDREITELFIDNYKQSKQSDTPVHFEYHRQIGPETRWFLVTVTFLGLEPGKYQPRFSFVASDITEHRRAEEALRESEEKLRAMFESMTDSVVLADLNGTVLDINTSATKTFGYGKDEIIGRNGLDIITFEDREAAARRLASVIYGPEITEVQGYRILDKNGCVVSAEIVVNKLFDSAGKPYGFIVVIRDVTAKRAAEVALKESEAKYRFLTEKMNDVVWTLDMNLHTTYVSSSVTRMLGFTPEERMRQSVEEQLTPESLRNVTQSLAAELERDGRESVDPDRKLTIEMECYHKNGSTIWMEAIVSAIRDEKGNIIGLHGVSRDVTARKVTEKALRESESKYRFITEKMNDIIWIVDMNFNSTYVSPSIARILGYTQEERYVQPVKEQMTPESLKRSVTLFAAEMERDGKDGVNPDRRFKLDIEYYHKNGSTVWMENVVTAIRDSKGKPIGLHGVSRDITERRRAQEALQSSEQKLRWMFESIKDGIFVVGLDGKVEEVNKNVESITGYSRQQLLGQKGLDYIFPGFKGDSLGMLQTMIERGGTRRETVVPIKTAAGQVIEVEASASTLRDSSGVPVGLIGIVRDVSERKRTEEELRESEERYRLLAENATDVIWTTNMDGRSVYISPSVKRLLGYTVEEAMNRPVVEACAPASLKAAMDATTQEMKFEKTSQADPNRSWTLELELYRKDGTAVPVETNFRFVRDVEGKPVGILAMARDISKRKRAEEEAKLYIKTIEALYGVAQIISRSTTLETMLDDMIGRLCDAMDTESGCIFMLDLDEKALKLKSCRGVAESIKQQFSTIALTDQGIEAIMGLEGPITEIQETRDVIDVEMVQKVRNKLGRRGIVAAPFFRGGDLQGLVVVFTTNERTFTSKDLDLLKALINELSIGINNLMLLEKTREMSMRDELTGLYNRRYFFEMLDVEMSRAERTKHPFSLIMLDLDGFKEYNDKYGHTNGDVVLQSFSRVLKSSLRKSDLAFRYGGDEFVLIFPSADAERAKKIIRRARARWQKEPLTQSEIFGGHVGFSSGIAVYPENAESSDGLIFLADAALYQAKKKGYEDKHVSELRTLSTDIIDVATQDQVYALAATVDARDPYTYGHSQRVADIAVQIGRQIGMSAEELYKLHAAALLHDIGKVGVPDSILAKSEKPSVEEWDVIRKHCAEGARILSYVKELSTLVPIVLHHHEWYNGSGYPDGLVGLDIPSGARITSVADAYDTMVTKRPYRDVMSPKEACEELKRNAGVQFDPVIVDVWTKLVERESKKSR